MLPSEARKSTAEADLVSAEQCNDIASAIIIRAAKDAECRELVALQRRASLAWDEYRELLLSHPEAIEPPAEQIRQKRVYVAERDGKIVGFAVVLPQNDGSAELEGLFVDPERWRSGIGSRIVRKAERMASGEGFAFRHVVAVPQARGFYSACGFELVGKERTRFGEAFLMRKSPAAS